MPESVTVPDVLKGHAADIWRSAFLSAYDGTCKERGDQRDSCAASIAWSAVKNKYHKNDQGEWVERESPAAIIDTVPVEDTPKALDRVDPNEVKSADWLEAFVYALSGPCATSETPIACAVAFADARFPRDPAGEPEVQAVTAEVAAQVEAVSRSAGVHPNDYGDLSLPLVLRKDYSPEKRAEFAKKGWALADGSYPIADKGDLMDAIHSFGRASEGSRSRVKAHITKRARELGATAQVSSEWGGKADKPEEKSTTALSERALLRAKEAEADARLLASPEADKVIVRPSHIGSNEWMARPLALRTLRAQIVERSIQRSYDDAVEMTTAEGWQPITNPTRSGEFIFQRWLDTPDGQLLQRAILVRKSGTFEWKMRELTRGASLSLAVQVPADERRYGDDRPFELMTRGGPGSGHFGHEGRPGQRGGSAPGEGGGETTISEGRRGGRRELSVPEQHQLRIARQTLKYNDVGAAVMGGMTKAEAVDVIEKLTGKRPDIGEPDNTLSPELTAQQYGTEQMAVNPPTPEEAKWQEEYEASKEVGREEAHAALAAEEEAQRQAFEAGKIDEEGTTISNADATPTKVWQHLDGEATRRADSTFTPEYLAEAKANPQQWQFAKDEAMGMMASKALGWDGHSIMRAFGNALERIGDEDHAATVYGWIAKERGTLEPSGAVDEFSAENDWVKEAADNKGVEPTAIKVGDVEKYIASERIAPYAGYHGSAYGGSRGGLYTMFRAALEDANWHDRAAQVQGWMSDAGYFNPYGAPEGEVPPSPQVMQSLAERRARDARISLRAISTRPSFVLTREQAKSLLERSFGKVLD